MTQSGVFRWLLVYLWARVDPMRKLDRGIQSSYGRWKRQMEMDVGWQVLLILEYLAMMKSWKHACSWLRVRTCS